MFRVFADLIFFTVAMAECRSLLLPEGLSVETFGVTSHEVSFLDFERRTSLATAIPTDHVVSRCQGALRR